VKGLNPHGLRLRVGDGLCVSWDWPDRSRGPDDVDTITIYLFSLCPLLLICQIGKCSRPAGALGPAIGASHRSGENGWVKAFCGRVRDGQGFEAREDAGLRETALFGIGMSSPSPPGPSMPAAIRFSSAARAIGTAWRGCWKRFDALGEGKIGLGLSTLKGEFTGRE
jgi:hypothetical protein